MKKVYSSILQPNTVALSSQAHTVSNFQLKRTFAPKTWFSYVASDDLVQYIHTNQITYRTTF